MKSVIGLPIKENEHQIPYLENASQNQSDSVDFNSNVDVLYSRVLDIFLFDYTAV